MSDRSRSSSPLELPSDTLAILNSFISEQKAVQEDFEALQTKGAEQISVEEFRRLFGEDWEKSQFWYSADFAYALARALHARIQPDSTVVFMSSPTAYVAYSHLFPSSNTHLFEYDERFKTISAKYTHFNLFQPQDVPPELRAQVDLVVVDPPFLNKDTNECVAQALRTLLKPGAEVVLLTSTSVRDLVEGPQGLYAGVGQSYLKETRVKVEHAGGIQNQFGVWANWDGAERWTLQ